MNRSTRNLRMFLLIMVLAGLSRSIFAQSASPQLDQYGRWINGISEPWWFGESLGKDRVAALQARWLTIENELKDFRGEELAGDYSTGGSTHGSYIRWSLLNGFVMLYW